VHSSASIVSTGPNARFLLALYSPAAVIHQVTPDYGQEPDFRWDPEFPAERWGLLTGVHVMVWNNEYRMYYSSWSSVEVPPFFQVPTRAGMVDSITALCLATRSAIPSARRPAGRAGP
jgi:hypothetical protein